MPRWQGAIGPGSDEWRHVYGWGPYWTYPHCLAMVGLDAGADGDPGVRWWARREHVPPGAVVAQGHTLMRGVAATKSQAKREALRACGRMVREKFMLRSRGR